MSVSVEDRNRRMLRARDAMDRTFAEPLYVPRLARIAEVSQAHFIRTFRATFGETPHRYLQRRRVERAMFLLRSTDRSVTDHVPYARADAGSSHMLRDGVGATEQFWRSAPVRHTLEWLQD